VPAAPAVSEMGHSTHSPGITPERQAAYLARQFVACAAMSVSLCVWYELADSPSGPDSRERGFGLLTVEGEPKPAFGQAKWVMSLLRRAKRVADVSPTPEIALFELQLEGDSLGYMAWSDADRGEVLAGLPEGTRVDRHQPPRDESASDPVGSVTLGEAPTFFSLPDGGRFRLPTRRGEP